jgi:RHS repeat-associated protein
VIVRRPLHHPAAFVKLAGDTDWRAPGRTQGALAGDVSGPLTYTAPDGTQVDFGAANELLAIRPPGEPQIDVTASGDMRTFTNGLNTLAIVHEGASDPHPGKVKEVWADGVERASFTYDAARFLTAASVLDPGDLSTLVGWSFVYDAGNPARLKTITRTAGSEVTTWSWTYVPNQVMAQTADEPALDQPLGFDWSDPSQPSVTAGGQTVATLDVQDGIVLGASGSGAPGIALPWASATVESEGSFIRGRVQTRTDPRGYLTRYADYDARDRPGRVVEAEGQPEERVTEYLWHPRLDQPREITRESTLTGLMEARTVFDYDDPAAPGDDPLEPNESPTDLVFAQIESGKTLDAAGAIVPVTATTLYTRDAAGRVLAVEGPRIGENFTEHDYDAQGRRTATRRYLHGPGSAYLETTYASFDARGNPQTVTDPNGRVTGFAYDGAGRIKTVTPPFAGGGSTIEFTYDVDGRITQIDFPAGNGGQPYTLRLDYDGRGNLLLVADSAGDAIVYTYEKSRRTRAELYRGYVDAQSPGMRLGDAKFAYDVAGRLDRAFNPLFGDASVYSDFGHDANGNVESVVDENGKPDSLLYDALDRLEEVQQIRTATYSTQFAYDPASNVSQVTDVAGNDTEYTTDDLGRLVKVDSPDTGVTLFGYDEAGNLVRKTEAFGAASARTTHYVYDGVDRLLTIDLPTNADWNFTYDTDAAKNQKGRLAQAANATGTVITALEYTERGQLAKESTSYNGRRYDVVYSYDAAGNVATIQTPGGTTMTYRYAGSRVREVDVAHGSRLETIDGLTWLPFGPLDFAKLPPRDSGSGQNVVTLERSYNLRYQLAELDVTGPSGAILDRDYFYASTQAPGPNDPGPNLDQLVDHLNPDESRFYFYDELDRLSRATDLTGANLFQYGHDPAGNRTFKTDAFGTTAYSYESGTDRLATATGAEQAFYANDAYGNRIYAGSTPYAGVPTYGYNDQNRLVTAKDANGATVTSVYDAFGRRIAWQTMRFVYDQAGRILEVSNRTSPVWVGDVVWVEGELLGRVENNVAAGVPTFAPPAIARFVPRDPAGWVLVAGATGSILLLLVSVRRRSPRFAWASAASGAFVLLGLACTPTGLEFYWIYTDQIGFPVAMTNTPATPSAAKVIWRASYEPFGLATEELDPDGDGKQVRMPLRFPGQWWDFATNLHDNGFRTYDPATGRYLEADPIGQRGGVNLYPYVDNDPLSFIDPPGLLTFRLGKFGGAGLGLGGQYQVALVLDTCGNLGVAVTLSGGEYVGASASTGVAAGVSTAKTIFDERGWSMVTGGSAGEGATAGFEIGRWGNGREGFWSGEAQVGLGGGFPVEAHWFAAYTWVNKMATIPGVGGLFDLLGVNEECGCPEAAQ